MLSTVNIAVIGAGFGQQVHVPAFRKVAGCEVRALCASRLERAQQAAQKLNIPSATNDWRALIANPEIHAVTLAVPPPLQAEIALAAAQAGKHIFSEKPLALNAAQAAGILSATLSSRIVHAMDFIFPEIAAWQKAKEFLQAGALGRIRHIALTWRVETFSYGVGAEMMNWKKQAAFGGGTLNNFVSHSAYYLEWLFGPVAKLAAKLTPEGAEVESRVDAWFEFDAGFSGTMSVAADSYLGTGHKIEVYGDSGTLVLDNPTTDYARGWQVSVGNRANGKLAAVEAIGDDQSTDGRVYPVSRIAQRFVSAILERGSVSPNLADGARAQVLLDTLRLADRTGSWQTIGSR